MDRLSAACIQRDAKSMMLHRKGFGFYPSDQANFPLGIGVAALCRSRWAGLYLAKIHTPRDRVLDEKNVALIRDYLMEIIRNRT